MTICAFCGADDTINEWHDYNIPHEVEYTDID